MIIDSHTHQISDADIAILNFYPENPKPIVHPSILLSCGIHPWFIKSMNLEEAFKRLEQLCANKEIQAIGECGLDTHAGDLELQKMVFERQIKLSDQYQLPLIVHSVKTHHLVLNYKKQSKSKQFWIIHGFNSTIESAQQFIKQEIFISFAQNLILNPIKATKLLNQMDTNYLLLETDNSATNIREIYKSIASLMHITVHQLENKIAQNFKKIFW